MRKLDNKKVLNIEEYAQIMEYAEKLRTDSPESYGLFYQKYAPIFYDDYSTHIPRFAYGIDELINFLITNQEIIQAINNRELALSDFPWQFHPYLHHVFEGSPDRRSLQLLLDRFIASPSIADNLPCMRTNDIIIKYEEANPYKEPGLKAHFDRIGRYSFVTRLQTYRYLNKKARNDKIEYLSSDLLGGIFTNKQKSIYYYIFLSEKNESKAINACHLLNTALHDGRY